jgi:O-methyltransferase domain/Dimerisation domain
MTTDDYNHLDESLPQVAMLKLITGAWLSQAIYAAAELGVADALAEGPKTLEALSLRLGANPPALYRLLRLLASHEIFAEQPDGSFAQTPRGECLEKDAFGSVRAMALVCGEEHYRSWGDILYSLKTGAPAFDRLYTQGFYEYLNSNVRASHLFNDAMSNMAILGNLAVAGAYPFPAQGTIVDVGGGHGPLLAAILNQTPKAKGILFDTPQATSEAHAFLQAAGVEERVACHAGNFFEAVPQGGDIYLLSRILQSFNDEACQKLLSNCRKAMRPGSKVLIIEMVIPPGNHPFFGKLSDLNMLIMTHGRERTAKEYAALLETAGLTFSRLLSTESPMSILEGVSA